MKALRNLFTQRPFVITRPRSAYSGTQRYTSSWFGDNVATWEHLSIANIRRNAWRCQECPGSDIGGFGRAAYGRAFARWIGLGFSILSVEFTPVVIYGDQTWTFDENITNITRKFIELRYKLLFTHTPHSGMQKKAPC
jgi:alpha-glucosidase